jgi:hypothetical protein
MRHNDSQDCTASDRTFSESCRYQTRHATGRRPSSWPSTPRTGPILHSICGCKRHSPRGLSTSTPPCPLPARSVEPEVLQDVGDRRRVKPNPLFVPTNSFRRKRADDRFQIHCPFSRNRGSSQPLRGCWRPASMSSAKRIRKVVLSSTSYLRSG